MKMFCKGCGKECKCTSGKCGGNCSGNHQCQCCVKLSSTCCQPKQEDDPSCSTPPSC